MEHQFQNYYRIYVWQGPIRIFHWVNVISLLVLIGTGIIIGNPPVLMSGVEASDAYWFGTVRFIHFIAAYIFTFNFVYRIFWGFMGNKYERWNAFWPFTKKRWKNLMSTLKVDIMLRKPEGELEEMMSIGHNQVAYVSYIGYFLLCLLQIVTGFALYADTSAWWFADMFVWFKNVVGGDMVTRLIHHVVMWTMIIFGIVHIYLVFYHDWLEGRGIVSSMFGGYKFIKKERLDEVEEEVEENEKTAV